MSKTKEKRDQLYHSQLREHGKCAIRFKSEPKESQYGGYIFIEMQKNLGNELFFPFDSPEVRQEVERAYAIAGQETWLFAEAAGYKDSATIAFEDANGNPLVPDEPVVQSEDAPFPTEEDGVERHDRVAEDAMAGMYLNCLRAARQAVERFKDENGDRPTSEEMRVATTLFINMSG